MQLRHIRRVELPQIWTQEASSGIQLEVLACDMEVMNNGRPSDTCLQPYAVDQ